MSPDGDRIAISTFIDEFDLGEHATDTLERDPVWMGGLAWTPDGQQLLYLSSEPGYASGRWKIHAVDAAAGSPSSALVSGVRSFDLGYPH